MAGSSRPRRSSYPSIKYMCTPLEGALFELVDFDHEDYGSSSSENSKQSSRKSESKSPEILSRGELITAVGQIWGCVRHPLAVSHCGTNLKHNNGELQNGKIISFPGKQGNGTSPTSAEVQYFSFDLMTTGSSLPSVQNLKVAPEMSFFKSCTSNLRNSLFQKFYLNPWEENGLAKVVSYNLGSLYGWMDDGLFPGRMHHVNSTPTQFENKKTGEVSVLEHADNSASSCVSGNTASSIDNCIIGSADCSSEITKCIDSLSDQNAKFLTGKYSSPYSTQSDCVFGPAQHTEENVSVSRSLGSRPLPGYHANPLASVGSAFEDCKDKSEENHLLENRKNQQKEFIIKNESKLGICSLSQDKPHVAVVKQEYALAGAFAGVFVSVCLHPVDTIKTVMQSCHTDQKSIHEIGRSIVSERGLTGLYRGIASNIASSAPISAVYTFTYESVKGALLPFLHREYHSFAHCMAGGCASVATSFIFTPSERIKQQMQVGQHYQNCWNALVGIIGRGGLPSLYTGWGAVLCRNVPHSIIKFYAYERLKQLMLSSLQPNAHPNTLQTLVCGGLAGTTAALFTTPFDVVKTKLQTQIPGSVKQYDGVFNTIKQIGMREGLRGLYRGLTPRLAMYMCQGALFFASYETFKRLFSLSAA